MVPVISDHPYMSFPLTTPPPPSSLIPIEGINSNCKGNINHTSDKLILSLYRKKYAKMFMIFHTCYLAVN